jgi:hypothetical protein
MFKRLEKIHVGSKTYEKVRSRSGKKSFRIHNTTHKSSPYPLKKTAFSRGVGVTQIQIILLHEFWPSGDEI